MWNKFYLFLVMSLLCCLSLTRPLTSIAASDVKSGAVVLTQEDQSLAQSAALVDPTSPIWKDVVKWLLAALLLVYEILARLLPTSRSVSIISFIIKVLKFLFPDTARSAPKPTVLPPSETGVHDDAPRKNIFSIFKRK